MKFFLQIIEQDHDESVAMQAILQGCNAHCKENPTVKQIKVHRLFLILSS